MMHPSIEHAMSTGYQYMEPLVYDNCTSVKCKEEIHYGDEFVEHAGYVYCGKECLVDQMLEDGNASMMIAEH